MLLDITNWCNYNLGYCVSEMDVLNVPLFLADASFANYYVTNYLVIIEKLPYLKCFD